MEHLGLIMPVHTILVLLLLAAGLVVTVVIALFHLYRFNGLGNPSWKYFWSENQSLKKVKERVSTERVQLNADEVFDSYTLASIRDEANPKSLIYDRLHTITNLQRSYARIDLDMLQTTTLTKESASKTFEIPGYFVGFAMLVGLLGTVVGLSAMIGDMQATIPFTMQNTDFVKSSGKIGEVLSSMQSAFAATIGGLCCSMISSLLNYAMRITQVRFHEKLDTFTVEELLPLVYRSREASDLLKDASENIEKTFSKLDDIGRDMLGNTNKLNAVHESFNTIITNLERITQSPHRDEMERVVQQLSQVITETVRVNQSVQNTVQYIPRVIEVMERNNQGISDSSGNGRGRAPVYPKEDSAGRFAGYGPPVEPSSKSSPNLPGSPLHVPKGKVEKSPFYRIFTDPFTKAVFFSASGLLLVLLIAWLLN